MKIMSRKVLLTVLPVLYLLIACGNTDDYANYRSFTPRDSSYTVSYPQTWDAQRGRRSFQLMLISPRKDSADAFQENVIIFREDAEGQNIDDYINNIITEKLPKTLKDFKLLSKNKTEINNEKAYRLEYQFSYRSPAKSIGYVFEKDGFAYIVLGTALDSTFTYYSGIFDKIGNSFKFNENTK